MYLNFRARAISISLLKVKCIRVCLCHSHYFTPQNCYQEQKSMSILNFSSSEGWISRWKTMNGLKYFVGFTHHDYVSDCMCSIFRRMTHWATSLIGCTSFHSSFWGLSLCSIWFSAYSAGKYYTCTRDGLKHNLVNLWSGQNIIYINFWKTTLSYHD